MSHSFYLIIHLAGLAITVQALTALAFVNESTESNESPRRRLLSVAHGTGLFLLLLGGFGMLARLGTAFPWPGWVWLKLGIWVILGAAVALIKRRQFDAATWFYAITAAVLLAASMGVLKPF